eukprot:822689_1
MMAEDMRRAQLLQTKCNYVSCFSGYWGYCAERGIGPYSNVITPSVVICLRLPIKIQWIVEFIDYLGVNPRTWWSCPLDNLMNALLISMLFLSIVRPGELLYADKTEDPTVEVITNGLRWGDITYGGRSEEYVERYLRIQIDWYKNKQFRDEPKHVYMAPQNKSAFGQQGRNRGGDEPLETPWRYFFFKF